MKRILVLLLTLLVLLAGCVQTDPEPSTALPTAESTQTADVPNTVPTDPPTEPTTAPTQPPTEAPKEAPKEPTAYILAPRDVSSLHDVYVYPYTQIDIDSVVSTLLDWEREYQAREEVLEFIIHWFTIDPIQLDNQMVRYDPIVEHWERNTTEEHYQNTLVVVGRYSVRYDHTLSPEMDADDKQFNIILCRKSPDAPWEHYSHNTFPEFGNAYRILLPEELAALELTDERILAGYFVTPDAMLTNDLPVPYEKDTYILYVVDEETNAAICREYPAE